MRSLTRRWRSRADHARTRRSLARALETANTPVLAEELRVISVTQFNR
jgi:hypothetical protein